MLKNRRFTGVLAFLMLAVIVEAQVTTASINGKVVSDGEPIIGATVQAIHEPSGTRYGTITNMDGNFNLQSMRVGGPYRIQIAYVGYQSAIYENIMLQLGDAQVLDVSLKETTELLDEIVILGTTNSNMKSDRAGAITSIDRESMIAIPTVNRSMNDIMRLSPQASSTTNGFAVGGGNYRQSYITVDGAAFNNTFGIGQNLPANGSPISLDALEQISVSVTPFDVRQSGFTGGSINAVTRSGDNNFKGTVYTYLNNEKLMGKKVDGYEMTRSKSQNYTYGLSIGGPIIKDKLFFFVNGEYEDNVTAGPVYSARQNADQNWGSNTTVNRPLDSDMQAIRQHLINTYNYDPGRYNGYSIDTPSYRLMARLDWNINDNHRLNFRFSKTKTKDSNSPSTSTSPLTTNTIYPGSDGIDAGQGRGSRYALYFESSRYYQERNFTSLASEFNSRFMDGKLNNVLRLTYSYQDEPRSFEGGFFPTVDILKDGAVYASLGPDPFTYGNLRQTKTFIATDELYFTAGVNKFTAGFQYEYDKAVNGYMPAGAGYYVFSSMEDFMAGNKASAFGITHSNKADLSQQNAEFTYHQLSAYFQDEVALNPNFRMTAGIRFELPIYPSLKNNYNEEFGNLQFGANKYSTSTMPKTTMGVSPRIGFNWDITGDRKYVARGGTGLFTGRIPFVWIVSTIGNSNVGQTQFHTYTANEIPAFSNTLNGILNNIYGGQYTPADPIAPQSPTIMSSNLKMPSTWKTTLAFDAKLPYGIDFTLEGLYNKDINPIVITNVGLKPATSTVTLSENDVRELYTGYWAQNSAGRNVTPYLIENGGNDAYYYSISAQLRKKFNFGLDFSFAYTHSIAKSYGDGIGDQVSSAWRTNTYSRNGTNGHEVGYGSYVAPHRIIASIGYRKEYGKNFASSVSLLYEGSPLGFIGNYSYSRYSYTYSNNVVKDGAANNLMYVPASKDELTFVDYWLDKDKTVKYTAAEQAEDFWNFVNQDKFLKKHKGEYVKRNEVYMPWHHQFDFKFMQDFYLNVGGKRNTLQLGVDITNLGNLLNNSWGLYKQVNSMSPLKANGDGTFEFSRMNNGDKLTKTFGDYTNFRSTYSVQFSIRYIFN